MTAEPTTDPTTSALEGPEPDSYADAEQEDAKAAYDHARKVFAQRIEEAQNK